MPGYILIGILIINITAFPVKAHSINEIHSLCKTASDYEGCSRSYIFPISQFSTLSTNKTVWRNYGPLEVNLSIIKRRNSNKVVQALNNENKPLYIGVNCVSRSINLTGINSNWKGWFKPSESFEHKLIKDLCAI